MINHRKDFTETVHECLCVTYRELLNHMDKDRTCDSVGMWAADTYVNEEEIIQVQIILTRHRGDFIDPFDIVVTNSKL